MKILLRKNFKLPETNYEKDIKYTEEIDENIDFEILSEEDIENYIYMEELENEKNKKDNE